MLLNIMEGLGGLGEGLKLNLLTFDLGDRKSLNIYLKMYTVKSMGQCRFAAVTGMDLETF
jgi:hypothetical protein